MSDGEEQREIIEFFIPDSPAGRASGADQEFSLKLLIPNATAGSVIGKAGATVAQLQSDTNAQIRLSQNRHFFPNTQDRVVLIRGNFDALKDAISAIISRTGGQPDGSVSARFAVPNTAAGLIIGHSGSTIRSFQEESGARVNMSQKTGVGERILSISGSPATAALAVAHFLDKLLEDPSVFVYQNLSTSYSGGQQGGMYSAFQGAPDYAPPPFGYSPHGAYGGVYAPPRGAPAPAPAVPLHSITVNVPDVMIGAIVGKSGANIIRIQRISGAQVKVSQRGEYASGTQDRIVTITGTEQATKQAHKLIVQKMQATAANAEANN